MITKYLKSIGKALDELNRIGYTEITDVKVDYTPDYDKVKGECSDYGILWICSDFDIRDRYTAVAYLYEGGRFELLKDNLFKEFKFYNFDSLIYSLNSGYVQINEIPRLLEASGWEQGDRDHVIAIDPKKGLMVSYNESSDKYLIEPYRDVESMKRELMDQVKKLAEVEKALATYGDLQDELGFLSTVRESIAGYVDIL